MRPKYTLQEKKQWKTLGIYGKGKNDAQNDKMYRKFRQP